MLKLVGNEIEKFAKAVARNARTNLTKGNHNVSRNLYRVVGDYDFKQSKNSFSLSWERAFNENEYAYYQDKGVKGAANFKSQKFAEPTPYKFGRGNTYKLPPIAPIKEWVNRKGIDASPYAIQRSIYQKGIPQTLFFTRAFRAAYKHLPEELEKAYALDVKNLIEFATKKLNK